VVVAITGASGMPYAARLLEVLSAAGYDIYLSISSAAQTVIRQELGVTVNLEDFDPYSLNLDVGPVLRDRKLQDIRAMTGAVPKSNVLDGPSSRVGKFRYCHYRDQMAPIASGSFLTNGMVVCPCSGGTLSAIVHGTSANLIHRAAEVHLKERRKLILVYRETPLSLIHIDNMRRAAEAGAIILPASPAFYHNVNTIADLVDFIVSRICDQLGLGNSLISRWGKRRKDGSTS
jgi:4-hydroxy-3-polyprenylbenzoate decarboxylase